MNLNITTIALLLCLNLYADGFRGKAGQEAFAFTDNTINARSLALSKLHSSCNQPNLYQSASFDTLETISFHLSPGLYNEKYSQLAWYIGTGDFQYRNHIQFYDRGEIPSYSPKGVIRQNNDHPLAWVLQQGVSYQVNSRWNIGADIYAVMEHLTHQEDTQTSLGGALQLGAMFFPGPKGMVWGVSLRNFGSEWISNSKSSSERPSMNTTIQTALSFRMVKFPRVKWSLGYESSAYYEPQAKISTQIQANRYISLMISTSPSHSYIYNSWNQLQGTNYQRTLAPRDFLGIGSSFKFDNWSMIIGGNLNQADYKPIYSVGIEYGI